jgi:hypothetical protein
MFGSNFVEIGIGLSLLFVLLSLICSHVAETVSRRLSWRSRFLEEGIRELLQDAAIADRVYRHPLIKGLGRKVPFAPNSLLQRVARALSLQRRFEREIDVWSKPPYIPSHLFARALLDTILLAHRYPPCGALCKAMCESNDAAFRRLAGRVEAAILDEPDVFATKLASVAKSIADLAKVEAERKALLDLIEAAKGAGIIAAGPEAPLDRVRASLERLEHADLKRALRALLEDDEVKDLADARAAVARWFDDGMDRVSGWYKRRSQRVVLAIAAFLTIALNIDTLLIADRLSRDATLRELVVAAGAGAGEKYKDMRPSNSFRPPAAPAADPASGVAPVNPMGADPNSPIPPDPSAPTPAAPAPDPADSLGGSISHYQKLKAEVAQLQLPIGWPTQEERAIASKLKADRDRAAEAAGLKERAAAERAEAAAKALEEIEKTAKTQAPGSDVNVANKVASDLTAAAAEAERSRAVAEVARAEATRARGEATLAAREAANERAWPSDRISQLTRLLGWLFTTLAAALGAQFWFDVLGRIVNLRMTGRRPEKAPPAR